MATDTVKLPATKPYRVVGVGATYLAPTEAYGAEGQPVVVHVHRLGTHGQEIDLTEREARRLQDLGAVKAATEPLSYDEMLVEDLEKAAKDRGVRVQGTGANGAALKEDYVNALVNYDAGASGGVVGIGTAPGGITTGTGEVNSEVLEAATVGGSSKRK